MGFFLLKTLSQKLGFGCKASQSMDMEHILEDKFVWTFDGEKICLRQIYFIHLYYFCHALTFPSRRHCANIPAYPAVLYPSSGEPPAFLVPHCDPAGIHGPTVTESLHPWTSHQHHTLPVHLFTAAFLR